MKKMLSTLFAACVTAVSMSLAQGDPDTYAVIDLSAGSAATSYPVSYMAGEPAGGWTNDLSYVTNKLVLRKIVETNGNHYYMGVFELTRGQLNCLKGTSYGDPQLPVSHAEHQFSDESFNEALKKSGSGLLFEYPTEAKWEYACRAGTTNDYHFGGEGGTNDSASLGDYAWYNDNSGFSVHPVGQKLPNPWGLYDLYGNMAEYCVGDIVRGGTHRLPANSCTSTFSSPTAGFIIPEDQGYRVYARRPILTVNGGTGGGNFLQGTTNTITATVPPHYDFLYWQVDPSSVTNAQGLGELFSTNNATTDVVMPLGDVTLTAVTTETLYLLTVENGTGSGSYTNGQVVTITANPTNTLLYEFDGWIGDISVLADAASPTTTVTIAGGPATVTATYRDRRYPLTVVNGTGSGSYTNGQVVSVEATVPAHHAFSHWEVDPPSVTNALGAGFSATNATTDVVMPLADVTLTAVIEPILYPLTVVNGSGSGSYTNGQIVSITANPTNTLLFEFDGWVPAFAVADPTNATTTMVMPGGPATVTATYRDKSFPVTVNFASSSTASAIYGATVTIGATTTPPTAEHEFDHWEGDIATVADVNSVPTTFIMPATNVTLTAIFRPKFKPQNTFLALNLSDNSVSYSDTPPAGGWTDLHKTTQMVFRKIPAGSFSMGSASGQPDETQHAVTLTKDFYLGIFEVTQKQWEEVRGTTPSFFDGDTLPVERVYYSDIRGNNLGNGWPANSLVDGDSFMGRLRSKDSAVGAADLPTEAQWEYACRAGTTGDYAGVLNDLAWYAANNTPNSTKAVGSKQPNPWGLHDMHGNVWEICLDWYTFSLGSVEQTDPPGTGGVDPVSPPLRVMRGGAYNQTADYLRSAVRWNIVATNQLAGGGAITNFSLPYGFRVAVPQATASYALTVVNGAINTGGVFAVGTTLGLSPAPAPAGMKFGVWQVNPAGLSLGAGFAPNIAQPLLTMPASALTVTAVYIPESSAGLYRFVQNDPDGSFESWRAGGEAFTITAPAPAPGYRFSSWTVTPAGANLGAGFTADAIETQVVMPAMDAAVTPEYVLDVPDDTQATPTAGVAFMLDAGQGQRPATFSASGLPRGLRIDRATGVISGVPSKPGDYTVTVTALHANGTSTSYTLAFTVQALDTELQGTFTGYCYEEDTPGQRRMRGLVTFKATKLGRLTAKVVLQTLNLSFSAKSWSGVSGESDYQAVMERRQGERLEVEVDAETGLLTGTLSGGRVGEEPLNVTLQRNAFLDRKDAEAQAALAAYKGYYTVALPIEACETDPAVDNLQSGSGYVTLTVRDRGVVKVAGKMADGTRVSLSTTLLVDDQGAYVPLFVKLYGRRGIFAGLLQLAGGTQPADQQVDAVPAVRLEWLYPGSTMAGLGDRFDAQLSATGAYYDTVGDLQAAYLGALLQAEGMEWAMPLVAGRMGSLTVDPAVENPQAVKFKAVRRSGLFSGSFRVVNEAGRNVTLKHVGVLTRQDGAYIGDGAYVERRSANGRSVKSSYRVWLDAP